MKFNIVKETEIFEVRYRAESNYLPNSINSTAYNVIDINHSDISGCNYRYLFCKLRSDKVHLGDCRSYYLNPNIQGSWLGSLNGNNKWELTLKVKSLSSEPYTSFVIHANAGWCSDIEVLYYNIGKSICNFLNKLSMFESLEDFKEYELIEKKSSNIELEQRILDLSKIIILCKKYTEINPSLTITKQMRTWIECNLKELFNTYRVKE